MSPEEFEVKDGISRRKMLKRVGAGAAIAWSAPILTSIGTPAFAQYGGCASCDAGQVCTPDCDVVRVCHGNANCGCFRNVDTSGCCCGDLKDGFCASFPPCTTGADCAGFPGTVCVASCCPTGICISPCGTAGSGRNAGSGARLTK